MGLYLAGRNRSIGSAAEAKPVLTDALEVARNLASYATYCGASLVVLPERLSDRQVRRGLQGQADENATGPDQLDLVLRLLRRQGYSAWLELSLDGKDRAARSAAAGLGRGPSARDSSGWTGRALPMGRPIIRCIPGPAGDEASGRAGAGAAQGGRASSGLLLQLGPGPTLLGNPDTGMDDDTFARFVHDTFGPETAGDIPGLGTTDPNRFAARSKYLSGVGRMPWLTWRSRAIAALYSELAEAARTASPGAGAAP